MGLHLGWGPQASLSSIGLNIMQMKRATISKVFHEPQIKYQNSPLLSELCAIFWLPPPEEQMTASTD